MTVLWNSNNAIKLKTVFHKKTLEEKKICIGIIHPKTDILSLKGWCAMTEKNKDTQTKNTYDDGNIPEIDLPRDSWITEPLPESTRPRKDGPGGDGNDR